jgi:hypothetical protein
MKDPNRLEPGAPEGVKPPFWHWIPAVVAMLAVWGLSFVAFTAVIVLASPTKSNVLAGLALFILIAGTGISAAIGFGLKQRMDDAFVRRAYRKEKGDVHYIS